MLIYDIAVFEYLNQQFYSHIFLNLCAFLKISLNGFGYLVLRGASFFLL
jgi:hypothetical protein